MTNEERQKLVLRLHQARIASHKFQTLHNLCEEAADEIERLAKEVARLKDENGVIREQCQNMLDMTVR